MNQNQTGVRLRNLWPHWVMTGNAPKSPIVPTSRSDPGYPSGTMPQPQPVMMFPQYDMPRMPGQEYYGGFYDPQQMYMQQQMQGYDAQGQAYENRNYEEEQVEQGMDKLSVA